MTDTTGGAVGPSGDEQSPEEARGPVIRDKRRIDPQTGQPRAGAEPQRAGEAQPAAEDQPAVGGKEAAQEPHPDSLLAADRLEDLRRLQAEYVNYRRRVERDREVSRLEAIGSVVEALLPVLDDIHWAREHGDLVDGPFAAMADKLETTLGRFGVARVGEVGEPFDPTVHEALMHLPEAQLPEGSEGTTIVQVMQPGFRVGERVVRAARVAVADPS